MLSKKEQKYWKIIKSNAGILYLMGRPGEAKTAMIEHIAKENDLQFIDLRISQMDETDIGLFPKLCGDVVKHAVPEWAFKANEKPSLIFFDELNRSRECIRNAVLQILNEKRIGYGFKFNSNVFMCSAGNLGESDGTSVDEFDSALWNRLIPVKHFLEFQEWKEGFADEHVWDVIVSFLHAHPENFYKNPSENSKQFATPRSWTFLSDYLKCNFGEKLSISNSEVIGDLQEIGQSFVGEAILPLIRYLNDMKSLNINDILERFDEVEYKVKALARPQMTELVHGLKAIDFKHFQTENVIKFLNHVHPDERASYLLFILDEKTDMSGKKSSNKYEKIWNNFEDEGIAIKNKILGN